MDQIQTIKNHTNGCIDGVPPSRENHEEGAYDQTHNTHCNDRADGMSCCEITLCEACKDCDYCGHCSGEDGHR